MKPIKLIFSFGLMFILYCCKPSGARAVIFNNQITNEQISIQDKENDLIKKIAEGDVQNVNLSLKSFLEQVDSSTNLVKALPKFDGKDDFKNQALIYFAIYKSIGENEYKNISILYEKGEAYSEDDENRAKDLCKKKDEKREKAFENFKLAQAKFAEYYHFSLAQ
jgi:hypothetical protein